MNKLFVPPPISCGILLSYRCNSECGHCMYACSPKWKGDWICEEDLGRVLAQLSGRIKGSRFGTDTVEINAGLHLTGGEPFLNFQLLLKAVQMAVEYKIPSLFTETDCFWSVNDEITREKLRQLKDAGLSGMLISVNLFILEYIPFERTERAIRIGEEIFGDNLMVYQEVFYRQFRMLGLEGTLGFGEYLELDPTGLNYAMIPMGRVPYRMGFLYEKYLASYFFHESCREELTRDWHVHIDNHCNYMPVTAEEYPWGM